MCIHMFLNNWTYTKRMCAYTYYHILYVPMCGFDCCMHVQRFIHIYVCQSNVPNTPGIKLTGTLRDISVVGAAYRNL